MTSKLLYKHENRRERDASNSPEMLNEVEGSEVRCGMLVSVEESERKVRAAEGREPQDGDVVVLGRQSLERSDIADSETGTFATDEIERNRNSQLHTAWGSCGVDVADLSNR